MRQVWKNIDMFGIGRRDHKGRYGASYRQEGNGGNTRLRIQWLTSESFIRSGIKPNRKHPKNIATDIKRIAIASSMAIDLNLCTILRMSVVFLSSLLFKIHLYLYWKSVFKNYWKKPWSQARRAYMTFSTLPRRPVFCRNRPSQNNAWRYKTPTAEQVENHRRLPELVTVAGWFVWTSFLSWTFICTDVKILDKRTSV